MLMLFLASRLGRGAEVREGVESARRCVRVVIRRLLGKQIVDVGVLGSGKKKDVMWHVPQSADSGNRRPRASVSLHIQKLKPQASIKKNYEFHKLLDVYNTIQRMMGVGQLRRQCYSRHQQNP